MGAGTVARACGADARTKSQRPREGREDEREGCRGCAAEIARARARTGRAEVGATILGQPRASLSASEEKERRAPTSLECVWPIQGRPRHPRPKRRESAARRSDLDTSA